MPTDGIRKIVPHAVSKQLQHIYMFSSVRRSTRILLTSELGHRGSLRMLLTA